MFRSLSFLLPLPLIVFYLRGIYFNNYQGSEVNQPSIIPGCNTKWKWRWMVNCSFQHLPFPTCVNFPTCHRRMHSHSVKRRWLFLLEQSIHQGLFRALSPSVALRYLKNSVLLCIYSDHKQGSHITISPRRKGLPCPQQDSVGLKRILQ